ncbi:bacitracin ABC transporter ATP-binding protein [Neobacillus muris]|nr:bacitracin ABC transporter ATP-binding protein [Neobacillus muris]
MPEENIPIFSDDFFNKIVKEINQQYGFPENEKTDETTNNDS